MSDRYFKLCSAVQTIHCMQESIRIHNTTAQKYTGTSFTTSAGGRGRASLGLNERVKGHPSWKHPQSYYHIKVS